MPWTVWFSFLTAPAIVGVAFTLSLPPHSTLRSIGVVIFVAVTWLFVAYQLKKYLKTTRRQRWVPLWITSMVILPLFMLFLISLSHDPGVAGVFQRHSKINEQRGPGYLAPAAPSRHFLSWSEATELLACMHGPAVRFSIQILTSLPPAWWLVAFGFAVWRGKQWK
jgi:hypothetical protein